MEKILKISDGPMKREHIEGFFSSSIKRIKTFLQHSYFGILRRKKNVWSSTKALYTAGLGEQTGVLKDSMIKVYLGYRNIYEILKLLKKKLINRTPHCGHSGQEWRGPWLCPHAQRKANFRSEKCEYIGNGQLRSHESVWTLVCAINKLLTWICKS